MSLRTDTAFFQLLNDSHLRIVGRALIPPEVPSHAAMEWLYHHAPFGLLAHDAGGDPHFVYGNRRAQSIFGYNWEELTALPSRLSAAAPERSEREEFLRKVKRDGYVSDYRGERVTKDGRRFWISDVTVWQLVDENQVLHGQAALIPQHNAAQF